MADLSIPNYLAGRHAYADVYEQFVSDASFLWILRAVAIEQPHYYASEILEMEQRIEAHLDGIMSSPDLGWQCCVDALELQEPGEVFTATVIAMRSHEAVKIQQAVEAGFAAELATPGLISALGWLSDHIVIQWIDRFLQGKDLNHKYLGLAACSIRRRDPGEILTTILQREDCQQSEKLYARALRLVGELRRQDCMPSIQAALSAKKPAIRFWAHWSAALLGQRNVAEGLKSFVMNSGPYQNLALQLAFRILPIETARKWVSALAADEAQVRTVIKATGVLGDPHAVNWLIGKMQIPPLAKLAAESFTSITGVDLEKHGLNIDEPTDYPVIPNDDTEDAYVGLDEDENLPYPDIEKVTAIWRNHGQNFVVGRRYFMGKPITVELLKDKLIHGSQRQRHAAAMELALIDGGMPLPNTRARILAS